MIHTDSNLDNKGYYGRLLRYIELKNDTDFGEVQLKHGFARVYNSDFVHKDAYENAFNEAKSNKIGIFKHS